MSTKQSINAAVIVNTMFRQEFIVFRKIYLIFCLTRFLANVLYFVKKPYRIFNFTG